MTPRAGKTLHIIDKRNPKDIIIEGLKIKIDGLGELRVPFDVTSDYPTKETYEHDSETRHMTRKIVVKKLQNSVKNYALGQVIYGNYDPETGREEEYQGYLDVFTMELSCWSTDPTDRDNIVELIKLWMLELEQEFQAGHIVLPYFYHKDLLSIKFLRAYEDINMEVYRNGPIYIGSLVFEVVIPFFHLLKDNLDKYAINLTTNVIEFGV